MSWIKAATVRALKTAAQAAIGVIGTGGKSGDQTDYETNVKRYYNYPWSVYLRPPADPAPKPKRTSKRPTGEETGAKGGKVYRLFNPYTEEHLYTTSADEYNSLPKNGWKQEDVAFVAPDSGKKVYRLINPNNGMHHYTISLHEAQSLWDIGWDFEGLSWFSGGNVAVWRLYNPYTGHHLSTKSNDEHAECVRDGWQQEGIGFEALK